MKTLHLGCGAWRKVLGLARNVLVLAALVLAGGAGCRDGAASNEAGALTDALRRAFPAHAERVLRGAEPFAASGATFALVPAGGTPEKRGGLALALPKRGEDGVRFRMRAGLELRVREEGVVGEGAIAESAVAYPRPEGTAFWAATESGYEEWLHLPPSAVTANAPVATWQVDGAPLRQANGTVEILGPDGAAQLRVTAPFAVASGDREVPARLTVRGNRIELWVDATNQELLVDPVWMTTTSMSTARYGHVAVVLGSGKVLVTGGYTGSGYAGAELYDPSSGTWSSAGSMITPRYIHTAVVLSSGKVLVAGGFGSGGALASAEIYDPTANTWSAAHAMSATRYYHTAVVLPSGKVLVAGGFGGGVLSSAETYDPSSDTWTSTANTMTSPRYLHAAVTLSNGKVLAAGGYNGSAYAATTDLYNPSTNTWSAGPSMSTARGVFPAVALATGKVLVCGGWNGSAYSTAAETYDPSANAWSSAGTMASSREFPTATLLSNGKVLVAGGYNGSFLAAAELYDPSAGTWSSAGSMIAPRYFHAAVLLSGSGKVLVTGGDNSGGAMSGAELFDPAEDAWVPAASMSVNRWNHTATALPNGQVWVAAGYNSVLGELSSTTLYQPSSNSWSSSASLSVSRELHTATLLQSGQVLVAGGFSGSAVGTAEVYDPPSNTYVSSVGAMKTARYSHTATLLTSGQVLVAGGYGSTGVLNAAELYDPSTKAWTLTTHTMNVARESATATLLPNGQVLVAGGVNSSYLTSAEIYNPSTQAWQSVTAMNAARESHTAVLLQNGKVLVVGGWGAGALASAEVYDPTYNTWTLVAPLHTARYSHTATLLSNGWVVVTGGYNGGALSSVEIYDPVANVWMQAAPMNAARYLHTVTLLQSGKLLAAGGYGLDTTELYTPVTIDDGNACTTDAWNPTLGQVTHTPVTNGTACNDGNPCTSSDQCTNGACGGTTVANGTSCGTGLVCDNGACLGGCVIGGTFYASGTVDPSNACLVCTPSLSTTAWSNQTNGTTCNDGNACTTGDQCTNGACGGTAVANGTSCGAGLVCDSGTCLADCYIGGTFYASGAVDPNNACMVCTPQSSTSAWSNQANGTTCSDGNACTSGDQCTNGACGGTVVANGTSCGTGLVCDSGACLADCYIGGTFYASGTVNPTNACQVCAPQSSTTAWSNQTNGTTCNDGNACTTSDQCTNGACGGTVVANGTSCGTGLVCNAGTCAADCSIAGSLYAAGAANPSNACQVCAPGTSTTAWSNQSNGTTCNDGNPCTSSDQCTNGACGGTVVANGTSCGSGLVCNGGSCASGCEIGGTFYASGAVNPGNACQVCTPQSSTSAWSNQANGTTCNDDNACTTSDQCTNGTCGGTAAANGTSCGTGLVCDNSSCVAGCYVAGAFYASGAVNPGNACQVCAPQSSTSAWSNQADGATCNDNNACTSTDQCTNGTCGGTAVANGTSCGAGLVCNGSSCVGGCFIGGAFYASGAANPSNACQVCAPQSSTSAWSNQTNGTTCNDGNACTQTDTCQSGACVGGNPVSCNSPPDLCHLAAGATCDTTTGACTYPSVTCNTPPDACHEATGVCDRTSGQCFYENKPNGAACDDGKSCTQHDACWGGVCTGGVVCPAPDGCHTAGACDASGNCSYTTKADGASCDNCTTGATCNAGVCSGGTVAADGTACDDGNPYTPNDSCKAGVCVGGTPTECASPPDNCHTAVGATADPVLGCVYPALPDGTACGDKCNTGGTCTSGACVGATALDCGPSPSPCELAYCDPIVGCVTNYLAPGSACDDGNSCTANDACNGAGICMGVNTCGADQCANKPDGTACNDGNPCTTAAACSMGTCQRSAGAYLGSGQTCDPGNPCIQNATCQAGGVCMGTPAPDGTACDDGNACTTGETCTSGVCGGGAAVSCGAPDACHVAGACDPASGCPVQPAGTACSTGSTCLGTSACDGRGACVSSPADFVPMPKGSWIYLSDYSGLAQGTDWTAALNKALEDVEASTSASTVTPVLYVDQPGTYDLSSTILVRNTLGLSIIGADPATTTFRWTGPTGVDMFLFDSDNSLTLSRLTLDGQGQARIAVHQDQVYCWTWSHSVVCWAPQGASVYDNEYSDLTIKGFEYGIVGGDWTYLDTDPGTGTYPIATFNPYPDAPQAGDRGSNNADTVIRRCTFSQISEHAVSIAGANAIAWQIWDSRFTAVHHGIMGLGDSEFFIYNNSFDGAPSPLPPVPTSTPRGPDSSIVVRQSSWYEVRGNVQKNGGMFLDGSGNVLSASVIGNRIEAFKVPWGRNSTAMWLAGGNHLLVLDNVIGTSPGVPALFVQGKFTAGGNTYNGPASQFALDPGQTYYVAAVDTTTSTLTTSAPTAWTVGEPVVFYCSPSDSCPGGLASGTTYYVAAAPTSTTVQLSATAGGAVVQLTSAATGTTWLQSATFHQAYVDPDLGESFGQAAYLAKTPFTPQIPVTPPAPPTNVVDLCSNPVISPTQSFGSPPSRAVLEFCATNTVQPTTANLQAAVNALAAAGATGSVIHLRAGLYTGITSTVIIPGGLDVTILGDGPLTHIWPNTSTGPYATFVFDLEAPAKASIKNLEIYPPNGVAKTAPLTSGIRVQSTDGLNDRVYGEQLYPSYVGTTFDLAGVDNVAVRVDQSDGGGLHYARVLGGGAAAANRGATRGLTMFGGAGGGFLDAVNLANYGKILLEEMDFEGGSQGSLLDGAGYLTQVGGRLATTDLGCGGNPFALPALPNSIGTAQMRGAALYANIALNSGLFFEAASSASFLALGAIDDGRDLPTCDSPLMPPAPTTASALPVQCIGPTPVTTAAVGQYVSLATTPSAGNQHMLLASGEMSTAAFQTCTEAGRGGTCDPGTSTCDVGSEAAFATQMLADLRAASVTPQMTCGQTDVRMSRLFMAGDWGGGRPMPTALRVEKKPDGTIRWADDFQTSAGVGASSAIAVDGSGNVFVAGTAEGTIDFGGGVTLPAGSYLAKLDASGNALWAEPVLATVVTTDDAGNAYVGAGGTVASYDPSGTLRWSVDLGATSVDAVVLRRTASTVVFGGAFAGTMLPSAGGLGPSTGNDAYVVELASANGAFVSSTWLTDASGVADQAVDALGVDRKGNLLVGGSTTGTLAAGGTTYALGSSTEFLLDLGNGTAIGLGNAQHLVGLSVDWNGDVVVAGSAGSTFQIGNLGALTGAGGADIFVAKLSKEQNAVSGVQVYTAIWERLLGTSADDVAGGVAVDPMGNVLVAGTGGTTPGLIKLDPYGNNLMKLSGGSVVVDPAWNKHFTGSAHALRVAVAPTSFEVYLLLDNDSSVDLGLGPLSSGASGNQLLAKFSP